MRVQDGNTPTIWRFGAGTPGFTWADIGEEILYNNSVALGASPDTGAGGLWNNILEDLYNRTGFLKSAVDTAGNRGFVKNVIVTATRALTFADLGLIRIATVETGGSQTTEVILTLPTRLELKDAGFGYLNRSSSTPFLTPAGGGVTPFIITGYQTAAGVPLKISVANAMDPGVPAAGSDFKQRILIGREEFTDIYLYEGEYAEFIPVIEHEATTDYWYMNFVVRVHNKKLFTKGGGAGVTVAAATYPTTNYDLVGDHYIFDINDGASLSYLPKSKDGTRRIMVRANTPTPGASWTLTNNGGSPPSADYKKILTITTANMSMKDGDVMEFVEESDHWFLASYFGTGSNFAVILAALGIETAARISGDNVNGTAISAEAVTRAAADVTLTNAVAQANSAWADRNNIADITPTGGSGTTVTSSVMEYRINDVAKYMEIQGSFTVSNTTAPTSFAVLIPGSKVSAGIAKHVSVEIFDGTDRVLAGGSINSGSQTVIGITPATALTNTSNTTVRYYARFKIA